MKAWFQRNGSSIDLFVFLVVVGSMVALALLILFVPFTAHSAACLSIDVPPQAVIGQPDGDTFHLFSLVPGGVVKIRVEGVNTPERKEPGWAEARVYTKYWLARGPFRVTTCGKPTLDRVVGTVERNGRTLAQDLLDAKLAR